MRKIAATIWPAVIVMLAGAFSSGIAFSQDEEPWLPTRTRAPVFPPAAFQRGITEGWVIVR